MPLRSVIAAWPCALTRPRDDEVPGSLDRLCRVRKRIRGGENGVDAVIVSNHGGRQEESNRSTLECLPEVVEATNGKIPVLIDGGFRRGTDIFKALALGANAVCIGRPYLWGLAAFCQAGVERVLEILREELLRIMQLAGTASLDSISGAFVARKNRF